MSIPPHYPVRSDESKKDRAKIKYRIRKSDKRRESTVEDKSRHATLYRVHIQRMIIQAAYSSRAHHDALYCV